MPVRPSDVICELGAYGLRSVRLPVAGMDPASWQEFLRSCVDHRLLGQLASAVADGRLLVTDAQAEDIGDLSRRWTLRSMLVDQTLAEIHPAIEELGAHVLLKGMTYARRVYPPEIFRPYVDVDLLVRRADFENYVDRLRAAGCDFRYEQADVAYAQRFGKGLTLVAPNDIKVDLHCAVAAGPLAHRRGMDVLFDRADTVQVHGHSVPAISVPAAILHTSITAELADNPPRLSSYVDLAWLWRAADGAEVEMVAQRAGLEWVVRRAVDSARSLMGESVIEAAPSFSGPRIAEMIEQPFLIGAYRGGAHRWRRQTIAALPYVHGAKARSEYIRASRRAASTP